MFRHPKEENTSKASTKSNKFFRFLKKVVSPASTSKVKEAIVDTKNSVGKSTNKVIEDTREKTSLADKPRSDLKIQDRVVGNIGLDEAFGFAEIPRASREDRNRIVNRFRYIPSKGVSGIT